MKLVSPKKGMTLSILTNKLSVYQGKRNDNIYAATFAYDENEVAIHITAEAEGCIHIGDIIQIPMNNHTFEERVVLEKMEK